MKAFFTHKPAVLRLSAFSKAIVALAALVLLAGCGDHQNADGNNANAEPQDANPSTSYARCTIVAAIPAEQHMVTSWRTAPTDALVTHPISALSVRQSFAPHWSGEVMRLRLSNRYSQLPLTLENVHIAQEASPGSAEMLPDTECLLTFGGESRITIAPGESILSDTIAYPIRAFERVGISFYAPELTLQITRHLGADEYLYNSLPGDYAADPSGAAFIQVPDGYASNFLAIEALEVAAAKTVKTVVTVGDSITDGSGSTTQALSLSPSPMTATDQRYPNHLQRRFLAAGLPLSIANAGIGGNELLGDALLPQFGISLLKRLDYDVLAVTGATHVLAMIGTNDLGNPHLVQPTAEDIIAGLIELVDRVHAADMKIILGTIPPAEGTITDGLPIVSALPIGILHGTPAARVARDAVNHWIREQQLSDGIVDFDICLEDPDRPGYLAPDYNSGDNLHPSPAGYAAMAECVNLDLFRASGNS